MDDIIYAFSLFGVFRVYTSNKEILLKEKLGKQLTSLFAFLLVNHNHPIDKDELINTFWPDSENPSNALKYAIHRLRGALKEIKEFEHVDIVTSANNTYQINPVLDISLDTDAFESAVGNGKKNKDLDAYKNAFDIYCGDFLQGVDGGWIESDRGYYKTIALDVCNTLSLEEIKTENYTLAIKYAEKGLSFDDLDERLIYAYLKALIKDKKYSKAMSYYKLACKNYYDKMGFKLESTNVGFQEIISNASDNEITSKKERSFDTSDISGPMIVDSQTLNSIVVYLIRNSERYDINAYVLTITFDSNIKNLNNITNQCLGIFEVLFRKNDVIAKISDNQFAILFGFQRQKDTKIIEERISSRLSKIYSHSKDITYSWRRL